MSAVIRIKRHIDEEPLNAFLLNCKKRKTLNDAESVAETKENTTQILKFSGTLTNPEDLSQHILKIKKDEAKEIMNKVPKPSNVTEKGRLRHKSQAQNNRFKVVNCTRTIESVAEEASAIAPVTILDVEKEVKPTEALPQDDDNFVFDVYVPENQNDRTSSDNLLDLDDVSVVEYVDSFAYSYRDTQMSDSDENASEDSNDENDWRNDYPDEDDFNESVGEEDMRRAIEDFDLEGDHELSSDDDDFGGDDDDKTNGFVYSIDSEAIGFEDDLDYCDVNRYGEAYARYKKRILARGDHDYLPKSYFKDDDDDDEDENYSD